MIYKAWKKEVEFPIMINISVAKNMIANLEALTLGMSCAACLRQYTWTCWPRETRKSTCEWQEFKSYSAKVLLLSLVAIQYSSHLQFFRSIRRLLLSGWSWTLLWSQLHVLQQFLTSHKLTCHTWGWFTRHRTLTYIAVDNSEVIDCIQIVRRQNLKAGLR